MYQAKERLQMQLDNELFQDSTGANSSRDQNSLRLGSVSMIGKRVAIGERMGSTCRYPAHHFYPFVGPEHMRRDCVVSCGRNPVLR